METIAMFGLATEVSEQGPVVDRTSFYKDGELLHTGYSHQSDSRHRGNYIVTQGQLERIYIRDLLRHKCIVERSTSMSEFSSDPAANPGGDPEYPVRAKIQNKKTGAEQVIQAKFLIGTDGAASSIRKTLKIPFDGMATDIYWGIMDCKFESDYPHRWTFG
jgi:phenol 2-monooxygenase (NADPH)